MPGRIFINYRRGDDAGFAQALYQRLEEDFPSADLFMDIEGHIKPGDDFVEVVNGQVAACDVMLAVIGPRWAVLMEARGGSADDVFTIEIRAALDQGKRVIPVLVGGASMPAGETLPEPIRPLARRNAVGLRPEQFKADCQGLVNALKEQLTAAEQERAARTEAERAAAEAERLAREAEEAARIAAAEERARAQAVAGLSQEEIRKAEELANWDFIRARGDARLLRDHLARFPAGVTALYARTRIEELAWAGLGPSPYATELGAFLEEFPNGTHAEAARSRLADLERQAADARSREEDRARETAAWGAVAAGTNPLEINVFLSTWPSGQHAKAARARLQEIEWGKLAASTDKAAIKAFLAKWPQGEYAAAARARLRKVGWARWITVLVVVVVLGAGGVAGYLKQRQTVPAAVEPVQAKPTAASPPAAKDVGPNTGARKAVPRAACETRESKQACEATTGCVWSDFGDVWDGCHQIRRAACETRKSKQACEATTGCVWLDRGNYWDGCHQIVRRRPKPPSWDDADNGVDCSPKGKGLTAC